jgi:hypothetical protein
MVNFRLFIHDNGKVHVMSNTRCGHTSMRKYFGFMDLLTPEEANWSKWINSTSRRVLVLRNPVDRWKSAEVFMNKGWFEHLGPNNGMDRDTFLRIHREPFLINISRYLNFEIIPFENLSDYLPWGIGTLATDSNQVHRSEVEMTKAMKEELLQYRYFRENYKVISPEEWRELTP